MKRTILTSILGIAAVTVATTSFGQGKINLNNYADTGAQVLYGDTSSGGAVGAPILNNATVPQWSIGLYYALGDVRASVAADPTGTADPSTLGGGLQSITVGTGQIHNNYPPGGYFSASSDAIINGWTAGSITAELTAYSGGAYGGSSYRGHSAAFLATPIASTALSGAPLIGLTEPGLSTFSAVPEPSVLALSGIGAAALMLVRRKK